MYACFAGPFICVLLSVCMCVCLNNGIGVFGLGLACPLGSRLVLLSTADMSRRIVFLLVGNEGSKWK